MRPTLGLCYCAQFHNGQSPCTVYTSYRLAAIAISYYLPSSRSLRNQYVDNEENGQNTPGQIPPAATGEHYYQ